MKKALKLELSLYKGHIKSMAYPLLIAAVFSYFTQNIIYATLMSTVFFSIRVISLPFDVLNQNEASRHMYNLLPITKNVIVTARYFAIFIVGCCLIIIGIALQSIVMFIFQFPFGVDDVLASAIVGNAAFLLLQSLQIPFFYQLGVIEGRVSGPGIIILISMLVFSYGFKYLTNMDFNVQFLLLLFCIASLVIFFISRAVSVKIVNSKGF